jgi:hypothetical protein
MNEAAAPVGELQRVAVDLMPGAGVLKPCSSAEVEEEREAATSLALPWRRCAGHHRGACPEHVRGEGAAALARRILTLRLLGWQPADVASRIVVGALFMMLALRIGTNAKETGHVTGLLLLASEALVVVLMIVRRPTADIDRRFIARAMTVLSMAGPPLVRPVSALAAGSTAARLAGALPGDNVTAIVSTAGLALIIAAKLSLGRSFGLVPANRGIVSTGPYRLVRHPIYLGYLVTHVAFVLANPLVWNFVILGAADVALVVRSRYEERTLERDPTYVRYGTKVRWRLVPGVY